MASRKSSIPVVEHSKQQKHHTMFNNSSISAVCTVSNFGAYTQHFKTTTFHRHLNCYPDHVVVCRKCWTFVLNLVINGTFVSMLKIVRY